MVPADYSIVSLRSISTDLETHMSRITFMKWLPPLCLGLGSGYAGAAGFQLLEQNASGLGNAYAGSAAVAENASTIFYNPAGMTLLKGSEVSAGIVAVGASFKFSDRGSSVGLLAGAGNGGDAGGWGYLPNGYYSAAVNSDLYLGIGVGAPYGLKSEYTSPWLGAAQSTRFDIKTYNLNPSLAYRLNDAVSVGVGLSWQRILAEYLRQLAVNTPTNAASPLRLALDGNSWGWNVGALFHVSPTSRVGVSYRSAISYDVTGNIEVTGPSAPTNAALSGGAKASLKLPDVFILSATQQVSDKWHVLEDLSWTGWGTLPKLDVLRASGALAQTLDTDFRDSWRLALGATYQYDPAIKLKFGLAYDQTPVKGEATRLVSLPDNDRTWFSFGTQWVPTKGSTVDLGISYLLVPDAAIDNNQSAQGRGRVVGSYSNNAWILGAQYSHAF
jgi:long-chain fatty acid transport protein